MQTLGSGSSGRRRERDGAVDFGGDVVLRAVEQLNYADLP